MGENSELLTIETSQALIGSDPEKTIGRSRQAKNTRTGQPVRHSPFVYQKFRAGGGVGPARDRNLCATQAYK